MPVSLTVRRAAALPQTKQQFRQGSQNARQSRNDTQEQYSQTHHTQTCHPDPHGWTANPHPHTPHGA